MNSKNPFEELENKIDLRFDEIKSLILANNSPSGKPEEPKYFYSLKELADFLGCSVVTCHKMKKEKRIPFFQTGRKLIFEKSAVLEAMQPRNRFRKDIK